MVFQINFSDEARKDLRKIDGSIRQQIFKKLDEIKQINSINCKNLSNPKICRIRIGDYRIVMDVDMLSSNIISIIMIDKKPKIYKRLEKRDFL